LLEDEDLKVELDQAVRFGLDTRRDDQGREWNVWSARLDWSFTLAWHTEELGPGKSTSPPIIVGERFPPVSVARVSEILKRDVFQDVRPIYPLEVHGVLHEAAVASCVDSVFLSDRKLDASILARADLELSPIRQAATVGGMNLAVPYLAGVPAGRLGEVRDVIPQAFLDFRSRLADIMIRAEREDPENASEIARVLAEREIQPALSKLEAELRAASLRTNVLGGILSVTVLTGALLAHAFGVGMEALLQTLVASGIAGAGGVAQREAVRARAAASPFYFLWRARQE
jgi:hypothetical protein